MVRISEPQEGWHFFKHLPIHSCSPLKFYDLRIKIVCLLPGVTPELQNLGPNAFEFQISNYSTSDSSFGYMFSCLRVFGVWDFEVSRFELYVLVVLGLVVLAMAWFIYSCLWESLLFSNPVKIEPYWQNSIVSQ